MSEEKNKFKAEAEALSIGLKKQLGPYATKFAERILMGYPPLDKHLDEILAEEWDGAIPDSLIGSTEEVSRTLMGVLHSMLEFAVEEAKKRKSYEGEKGMITYYVEPYYDDTSTMLVIHKDTDTLLYEDRKKTYHFDPDMVERTLKEMVEGICEGIELVRKRA